MNLEKIIETIDEETYDRYEKHAERHLLHGTERLIDTLSPLEDKCLPKYGKRYRHE